MKDDSGSEVRVNGLASLALRAHYVRLSPLRGSVELPACVFFQKSTGINTLMFTGLLQGRSLLNLHHRA